MELGMSARDRKTLTIGACVIGALFGVARGLPMVTEWQAAQRAAAMAAMSELSAARAARETIGRSRDSLRVQKARLAELDSVVLSGATSSAAAAQLASTLEDLADDARVKVSAMQLHADSAVAGSLTQVAVRLTAVADVYGLLALMRAIEGGDAMLAVRELSVAQSEPAAPDNKAEALRLDITVVAMAKIAAEKR